MSTKTDIKLPPLPGLPSYASDAFVAGTEVVAAVIVKALLQSYARQAVELDRQQRGEAVAWLVAGPYEKVAFADRSGAESYCRGLNNGYGKCAYCISPLFSAPQPAEPVVKQSLTTEREAFEAWASNGAELHRHKSAEYSSHITQFAWAAWQARAALAQPTTQQSLQVELVKGESSDDDLETFISEQLPNFEYVRGGPDAYDLIKVIRAALARYGAQPAASAEPVMRVRVVHQYGLVMEPSVESTSAWFDGLPEDTVLDLYAAPVAVQPSVPDGWVLVPKDPTNEMILAFWLTWKAWGAGVSSDNRVCASYQEMLCVAPTPPADEPKQEGAPRSEQWTPEEIDAFLKDRFAPLSPNIIPALHDVVFHGIGAIVGGRHVPTQELYQNAGDSDAAYAALRELVRLKDIKDRMDRNQTVTALEAGDYRQNKPKAWERARAVVAVRAAKENGNV